MTSSLAYEHVRFSELEHEEVECVIGVQTITDDP